MVAMMADRCRILVVEDDENLNRSIVNSLRKDGYFVHGVANGAEAIRSLWSVI
jgi:CheY-like chemotaxis protein